MRHEVEVTIDAPAELVWRTISDVAAWPEWTPTMRAVRRLEDGELREGASAEVEQPAQPKRTWTVTALTPGKSFTWTARDPSLRYAADHVVTVKPDGKVTVLLTFSIAGLLAPIAGPLVGWAVRRAIDTEAASLKKWCEKSVR